MEKKAKWEQVRDDWEKEHGRNESVDSDDVFESRRQKHPVSNIQEIPDLIDTTTRKCEELAEALLRLAWRKSYEFM